MKLAAFFLIRLLHTRGSVLSYVDFFLSKRLIEFTVDNKYESLESSTNAASTDGWMIYLFLVKEYLKMKRIVRR